VPFSRGFIRSPSPKLRQATTTASIRTYLSFRTPRPGPRPAFVEDRQGEAIGEIVRIILLNPLYCI
jgi:hypothetical protein